MFQLPQTQDDKIACFITNKVCFNGDSYIYRSFGRRKAGRKARYLVHIHNDDNFVLTASSDEEAIVKANERLARRAAELSLEPTEYGGSTTR